MSDYQQSLDERLKQALDFGNYRSTFVKQHEQLKLKLQQDLTLPYNGGSFKADQQLISFVSVMSTGGEESAVLIDLNGNPIKVDNLQAFLRLVVNAYSAATNGYLTSYQKLRSARTVEALLKA